jgi:hypothetical protein
MRIRRVLASSVVVALGIGGLLVSGQARLSAQPSTDPAIRIGAADLGGVVTSATGPEAGVWVIAETTDLQTRFAKIVVTDERGRYVLPDLPKASYSVWVRGYGLVDSPKGADRARQDPQPERGGSTESSRSGGVLPGHLLVFDAEDTGHEFVSRYGCRG